MYCDYLLWTTGTVLGVHTRHCLYCSQSCRKKLSQEQELQRQHPDIHAFNYLNYIILQIWIWWIKDVCSTCVFISRYWRRTWVLERAGHPRENQLPLLADFGVPVPLNKSQSSSQQPFRGCQLNSIVNRLSKSNTVASYFSTQELLTRISFWFKQQSL